MSRNGSMPLGEVRGRAAAALEPVTDGDPDVLVDVVDSVTPPALMLLWDDPWLTPNTFGPSVWSARLEVLCVAARVEVGPGFSKLEELVSYVVGRMKADAYPWPLASSEAPRVFRVGGQPYLGARLIYELPVSV